MGRMAISLKIRRLVQLKRLDVMRIFDAVVRGNCILYKTPAFGCSRAQNSIRPIVDSLGSSNTTSRSDFGRLFSESLTVLYQLSLWPVRWIVSTLEVYP